MIVFFSWWLSAMKTRYSLMRLLKVMLGNIWMNKNEVVIDVNIIEVQELTWKEFVIIRAIYREVWDLRDAFFLNYFFIVVDLSRVSGLGGKSRAADNKSKVQGWKWVRGGSGVMTFKKTITVLWCIFNKYIFVGVF